MGIVEERAVSAEDACSRMYDVAIVGAGVAGAALATVLARDNGLSVVLVERDVRQPERIVGELLQPGGVQALRDLKLLDAVEGIDAQEIVGYGIFLGDRSIEVRYEGDTENDSACNQAFQKEQELTGRSFHNGRFVQRLRELAVAESNVTLVQGTATQLTRNEKGVTTGVAFRTAEKEEFEVRSRFTVACDGCASRLRSSVAPASSYAVKSTFVGMVLKVDVEKDLPFRSHGHVLLVNPSPVLFYPISSSEVRCLVDFPSSAKIDRETYLTETVLPQVPPSLRASFAAGVAAGGLKCMPNRVMPAEPYSASQAALLLGDSFNMRHPLTGGGMTVALSDVKLIQQLFFDIAKKASPDSSTVWSGERDVSRAIRQFYTRRRPRSSTINILADALYAVFCGAGGGGAQPLTIAEERAMDDMRDACFEYLGRGGRCSTDPIRMLGGLEPRPMLLLAHFFAVALYGCGRALFPFPTPARVLHSWTLFRSAFNIVKPLIDAERVTLLSWIPIARIPTLAF
uniref:Squalene monooxygenase n=1 Tax=Erythrolobus madagascarensis TaxID=708628 RepID=A0A7S0T6U4_9RHOD|mmetsp:Transcript_939/g.1816  ORF Transcript_939/g.1816 Transcript_939/m.1816 type:complete len:514 (+) Transcript_939:20-1561(+)